MEPGTWLASPLSRKNMLELATPSMGKCSASARNGKELACLESSCKIWQSAGTQLSSIAQAHNVLRMFPVSEQ